MKRRELFATLGAVLGAAIGGKVVASETVTTTSGGLVTSGMIEFDPDDLAQSDYVSWDRADELQRRVLADIRNMTEESARRLNISIEDFKKSFPPTADRYRFLNGNWLDPIADIANRPDNAQRIFEFVANTSCQYTGVAYVELNDPTVIISGDCGTSKSSVLITPTSIRYRTITNRGQEIIHDAKTQKVIDFIRTLGYDFQ